MSVDTGSTAQDQAHWCATIEIASCDGTLRRGRALARDPRRGGLGLRCAKLLHRTGKYEMFIIKKKKKSTLYKFFKNLYHSGLSEIFVCMFIDT